MAWLFRVLIAFIPLLANSQEGVLVAKTWWEKESKDKGISYEGYTQLMAAIEGGASLAEVQSYIDSGADVNAVCSEHLRYYNPVLRYALDRGIDSESVAIIKALLTAGADTSQYTYNRVPDQHVYGFMPLISYAAIYSSSEVVQLFIDYGADVNQTIDTELGNKKTALSYAQELGKEEIVALLKKQSVAPEACDLVDIGQVIPEIVLDIRYATSNNFLGFPVYAKSACYLHKKVADALSEVQKELSAMGLGLKIFDGYRPLSVQQTMWDAVQDERYVSNPAKNKGRHTRGTAVDLTLVDREGNELEMPTPFDDFTEKAHSDYEDLPEMALKNRSLLADIMKKHGFYPLPTEWWHFDFSGWQDDEQFPPLDISL